MAAKGGGAWKVAYADFVTAMMAFFLVMWIVGQSEQVREAVAHSFSDPFGTIDEEGHDEQSRHHAAERTRRHGPQDGEGEGRVLLINHPSGQRTAIGVVIPFADGSAELDEAARHRIDDLVPLILGKPQKVEVRGHSSRKPLPDGSPFHDHWDLSYARAMAALRYLEQQGIARERLRLSQAAGNEPPTPFAGTSIETQDRVEINLLSETAILPSRQAVSRPSSASKVAPAKAAEQNSLHEAH